MPRRQVAVMPARQVVMMPERQVAMMPERQVAPQVMSVPRKVRVIRSTIVASSARLLGLAK
jgi:hypothetical protein